MPRAHRMVRKLTGLPTCALRCGKYSVIELELYSAGLRARAQCSVSRGSRGRIFWSITLMAFDGGSILRSVFLFECSRFICVMSVDGRDVIHLYKYVYTDVGNKVLMQEERLICKSGRRKRIFAQFCMQLKDNLTRVCTFFGFRFLGMGK